MLNKSKKKLVKVTSDKSRNKKPKGRVTVKKNKKRTTSGYKSTNSNVLSIIYDVWISGTKLSLGKKSCISSIEIKETVTGSDVATIVISDPEFLYIEDNIFLEDNKIKIKMGWSNTTYRVTFEGYISAIDIEFESTGIPKLTLTCMDKTHRMNRKKRNKTYKKTTSAEVVKSILKSYGFSCDIDKNYKFTKQDSISQSNQTDIDFITNLAGDEVHPFTAYLRGNTFHYTKMGKLETPKLCLTYKKYPHEIISFSPKINKETKQKEIKSASVNTKKKSVSKSSGVVGSSNSTKGGSSSSNGSTSSRKSSGGYTYNPQTRKWSQSKK